MKFVIVILVLFYSSFLISGTLQDLVTELDSQEELSGKNSYERISTFNNYPEPIETGIFIEEGSVINDALTAPFVYYIPADYDPSQAKPLLIYLHGLVGVPYFIEDPLDYARENYFTKHNEDEWFLLYPTSNIDCMWWDLPGTNNLEKLIRYLKNNYNIDDNRVFVTGFSDGGSGSFHLALNDPDDYASLYPLNGMLSVGHAVNGLPVYPPNLMNRYTRVINTDLDTLYPASEMRKLMDLALTAGADLFYKEYWGIAHDFSYAEEEIPQILADMELHPRNPFRQEIYWETSLLEYGKCDWLEIVELDTLENKQDWHIRHNLEMVDKRMSFGFYNDQEFTGTGAKVTDTVENSAVANMGIEKGDIIVAMDGINAADIDELIALRDAKERGDEFNLTILRDDQEIVLEGRFPDPESYQVFNYTMPSGAVKARYYANQFHLETSCVGKLAIYINPDMVNLAIPVKIYLNDDLRYDDLIEFEPEYLITEFKLNMDRKALWVNRIQLNVRLKE